MYNTIRLLRGEERLSYSEFKKFQRGDTIFGVDSDPTEIKRWSIIMAQLSRQKSEIFIMN